jgi:hypothetical protein
MQRLKVRGVVRYIYIYIYVCVCVCVSLGSKGLSRRQWVPAAHTDWAYRVGTLLSA